MRKVKIQVYVLGGNVFEYEVANISKAREHADRIINTGWRNIEEGVMIYYPVHKIEKVKFDMPNKDKLAGTYFAEPI